MPSGSTFAGRKKRRKSDNHKQRQRAEKSSDEDVGDPYDHIEARRFDASSKRALKRQRSWTASRSPASDRSALEDDVFHTKSHPVSGGFDGFEDPFVLVAREVDPLSADAIPRQGEELITWSGTTHDGQRIDIETDRYDVLHLLSILPAGATIIDAGTQYVQRASTSSAPDDGLDDLPSDAEDVFFLKAGEVEVYRRQKQQKRLEVLRQERIDALRAQDEAEAGKSRCTSPSCKENAPITQDQLDLMQHTANALRHATNRAALETRILANHGSDTRFAFLRRRQNGQGSDEDPVQLVWKQMLDGRNLTLSEANGATQDKVPPAAATALVAYSSGSESDEKEVMAMAKEEEEEVEEDPEARRKRKLALAREWSRKRQAQKSAESTSTMEC